MSYSGAICGILEVETYHDSEEMLLHFLELCYPFEH